MKLETYRAAAVGITVVSQLAIAAAEHVADMVSLFVGPPAFVGTNRGAIIVISSIFMNTGDQKKFRRT